MVINSDSLVLPRMGWEMWHVPHAWQHFQWPRVPSLFPDMLWFWLAESVRLDWRVALDGFFLLSLCLMTACLASVIWRMGDLAWPQALFVSSFTLAAVVACVSAGVHVQGLRDVSGLLELFLPAYHGSAFMLSLLAATLANWEYGRGGRIANFCPTACLCLVATFSDPLFVTTFAVPFALSTGLFALRHRKDTTPVRVALKDGIGPSLFLLGACTVGFVGQELLYKQNLGGVFKHFPLLALPEILYSACFSVRAFCCLALFALSIIPFIRIGAKISAKAIAPYKERLFYHGYAASIISLCILSVSYVDVSVYRYALPVTWWSIIFLVSCPDPAAVRKMSDYAMVCLPCAFMYFVLIGNHGNRLAGWHSPLESCISQNHDRLGLRGGLAQYWLSRKLEASSDWALQIEQVTDGNHIFIWGNNPDLYAHDVHGFDGMPVFNYFVDDGKEDLATLYRDMGPPAHVLHCPEADVLVFGQPVRLR
ncbi:hypothetical protein CFR78_00805 [Komagataeibacter rhaeticus]|uniref:Glycosyltransferase RgtA/B/C/D-like domain-containing protein n=1 Tax=Komagataeibacter rhaeticus TaxID=215221 RepID=A0A858JCW5_9PROT|nr:hypothetical protein [Komagataeibacter rhaeticus]ATU74492.1 hypothetical protein CT154_15045 [Komagataeibacter xylinus]KDU94993.1 hypothetical protein GLUCORHAEAF1_10430 [Komagataeibacter rhaeticus AF1]MBL7239091.1 hypothetical protein [Komagataeibacter rhaeticus]PYD55227.1 hypothetical protein CFR78_00805 [Komagataeibacter rhaeticus]QIP34176.1 hypothetical protein GWK63_00480 [Komagataeibacter rhaeticus]